MKVFLTVTAVVFMTFSGAYGETFKVERSMPVNVTVEDALQPFGLVKTPAGSYVALFQNKGDSTAGCKTYFARSTDGGVDWEEPYWVYQSENPAVGASIMLSQLKDGAVVGSMLEIRHADLSVEGFKGHRTSRVKIIKFDPEITKFEVVGELEQPGDCLMFVTGNGITELANGDLLLPAYIYPKSETIKDFNYGSGYFRSSDGGKTWSKFQCAFTEPHPAKMKYNFNESAFAEAPDGTLTGFARVDTTGSKKMWKVVSSDGGKTWSKPVESEFAAVYPIIRRLPNGIYVMMVGDLSIQPPRSVAFYTSTDGKNFRSSGRAWYSRNKGISKNTATGGTQSLLMTGDNEFLVTFYAHDPVLTGRHKTYIDSNLISIKP